VSSATEKLRRKAETSVDHSLYVEIVNSSLVIRKSPFRKMTKTELDFIQEDDGRVHLLDTHPIPRSKDFVGTHLNTS
jgi:hypothetical protein